MRMVKRECCSYRNTVRIPEYVGEMGPPINATDPKTQYKLQTPKVTNPISDIVTYWVCHIMQFVAFRIFRLIEIVFYWVCHIL